MDPRRNSNPFTWLQRNAQVVNVVFLGITCCLIALPIILSGRSNDNVGVGIKPEKPDSENISKRVGTHVLGMESVKRARERLSRYPALLGECREPAKQYAACVIRQDNVVKASCQAEFTRFKDCLLKASTKMATRL